MISDLDALRAETLGAAHHIHLNNAGAALPPAPVMKAIRDHLDLEEQIGGYEAADGAADEIEAVYDALATLLATGRHQIALTEHATAAFVQALSSIPFREGDAILTTRHDYSSNQIQYLSLQERLGVELIRAPDAPEGGVDVGAMRDLIHRRRPRLVAVTHIPTNSGLVQDVEAIGEACRERDILYLVDACQSVGQMPVHPDQIGCDFLSATSRKFLRGPRGAGFLWVSDRVLDAGLTPLFPDLRGSDWVGADLTQPSPDARRFESWEFAWALILGMGEAARYAQRVGLEAIRDRVRELARALRTGLKEIDGLRVLDQGAELSSIVTVSHARIPAGLLRDELRTRGIHTSWLSRESAVLDFDEKRVETALRLSPHYYNTEAEIDRTLEVLAEVLAEIIGAEGAG